MTVDEGNASRIRREAGAQGRDVGQAAGLRDRPPGSGQLGLAAALVGERQQVDHDPAGLPLRQGFPERLEGAPVGLAREELVAVDEVEQRHRLAAQRVDDVTVVDDLVVPAVRVRPPARERHQVGAAEEHLEPIVVEADAQAMADQARGHGVEHLAQREAARRGDADRHLLVVAGPPLWQSLEGRPFAVDPLGIAGVAAADDLVDEAAVGGQIGEVGEPRSRSASAIARFR